MNDESGGLEKTGGGRLILYLLHRSEYRQTEMCLTGLLWRNTPNHLGSERQCFLYMESSLCSRQRILDTRSIRRRKSALSHSLSREPLAKYFGVLVDEEVLDGILVTLSGGRLRERPASS
jgi:hypothetical protein